MGASFGARVADVCRRHDVSSGLIYTWRRKLLDAGAARAELSSVGGTDAFVLRLTTAGAMLIDTVAPAVAASERQSPRDAAVTGYGVSVDWSASALIEIAFLDLVLGHGIRPAAAFDALKACWGADPVSFTGEFFDIPESDIRPKPLQKPHPPLWVACSQLQTLTKAGEWGMGALGFQFVSADAAHA